MDVGLMVLREDIVYNSRYVESVQKARYLRLQCAHGCKTLDY
jgi:hypothetical protein